MTKIPILLFLLVSPIATMAQGPVCSELKIREAVLKGAYSGTDDAFFWSGAYDKPLIGSAESEQAYKKLQIDEPERTKSWNNIRRKSSLPSQAIWPTNTEQAR